MGRWSSWLGYCLDTAVVESSNLSRPIYSINLDHMIIMIFQNSLQSVAMQFQQYIDQLHYMLHPLHLQLLNIRLGYRQIEE